MSNAVYTLADWNTDLAITYMSDSREEYENYLDCLEDGEEATFSECDFENYIEYLQETYKCEQLL